MAFEPSNDFLHANGIDHEHGADGSITSVRTDSTGSIESNGSSIQDSELEQALGEIDPTSGGENTTSDYSSGSEQELDVQENEETEDSHDHGGDVPDDHNHAGNSTANLPGMGDDYDTQNGTNGSDTLIGGDGNDFLFRGDETLQTATAAAGEEFPFATSSESTGSVDATLKDGTLTFDGRIDNLDGAPLFSQGETTIDPDAEILNGSDPEALINGFLRVPEDVEGNQISGTHLHFSPSGDDRGDFADATVIRFAENTVTTSSDGISSDISGEFELTPEEQAAFTAGNLYLNVHTNEDTNNDGKAGFPTGEARFNFNQEVIKDAA